MKMTYVKYNTSITNERSDALEVDIKNHQAHLLKLQEVDKALEARAVSLEQASQERHKQSKTLSRSHNLLNKRGNTPGEEIAELQMQTKNHSGMISTRQDNVVALSSFMADMD